MNMGIFEFVLGIVLIATIGGIIKARYGIRTDQWGNETQADADPRTNAENDRLRSEIGSLKERIQVLERVITDSESSSTRLDREIEQLRDKNHV
jgi:septal ring factor EnvC (AmiA/AmiB activator)